jgi:hypothetical protein
MAIGYSTESLQSFGQECLLPRQDLKRGDNMDRKTKNITLSEQSKIQLKNLRNKGLG